MEIIDNNIPETRRKSSESVTRTIYLGVALIVIGLIWLLHNFDLLSDRFFDVFFSWQMLLVVIGGYLLTLKRWIGGGVVTAIGIFYVLTDFFDLYIPLTKIVLPVAFIAAGIMILFNRKR